MTICRCLSVYIHVDICMCVAFTSPYTPSTARTGSFFYLSGEGGEYQEEANETLVLLLVLTEQDSGENDCGSNIQLVLTDDS